MDRGPGTSSAPSVAVFTPTPLLTVTIEADPEGDDVHLHAGGQGVWISAMLSRLGVEVTLTCPLGGETGPVLEELLSGNGVCVRATAAGGRNGAYVHDRRSGTRQEIAKRRPSPLERHEVDDLYGRFLVAALKSDACVLGGPDDPGVVPAGLYGRFAEDLRLNGVTVVVDLTGEPLESVLAAGVSVVKLSDEELGVQGRPPAEIAEAADRLGGDRVGQVLVTSADGATISPTDAGYWVATGPELRPIEPRGAGDSFTATYTASKIRGDDTDQALRRAVAAGALNVTRRGLASGDPQLIDELAATVEVDHVSWARSAR